MDSAKSSAPAILEYAPRVVSCLADAVASEPGELGRLCRHALGVPSPGEADAPATGGKRIRPCLVLAACEALGGNLDEAMPAAVAIEMVHNFSLVHDDIEDGDQTRHGQPTVWKLAGEAQGINTGDYLVTRAIQHVVREVPDPSAARDIVSTLADAMTAMIRGQWQDIAFETQATVPVEAYLDMIRGKTGAMLGAALEAGVIAAGQSGERRARFREWGITLGLVFQARDDYLGTWGDPSQTGKAIGSDIRRRKRALPLLLALEHPDTGSNMRNALDSTGDIDVEYVMALLERAGTRNTMEDRVARYRDQALEALAQLELPPTAHSRFEELVHYFASRER
ncbi:MAG: polyprenyl synthetase family protein [Dehalococcoidia bacterium]|nr:polyprenyl synthetase family protein [Dehalococcoidia bacterium]